MNKEDYPIRITLLKRFDTREVFKDPPVKAKYSGPCPIFKEGQAFDVDDSMPRGFYPYTWNVVFPFIVILRFNGNCFEWYEEPAVVVGCCPDGLKPVVFKIELK